MGFEAYFPALGAVALFAVLTQVVAVMAGMGKTSRGLVPGAMPVADYNDWLYRTSRASANAIETIGIYIAVVGAAILAGVDPIWVNRLAIASLVFRLGMVVTHIAGVGKPDRSIRTVFYMGSWLAHTALAIRTLMTVF